MSYHMKWHNVQEIVENLEDKYPNVDIINIRYTDFHSWIINLDGFVGDKDASNEKILESIHLAWLKERGLV